MVRSREGVQNVEDHGIAKTSTKPASGSKRLLEASSGLTIDGSPPIRRITTVVPIGTQERQVANERSRWRVPDFDFSSRVTASGDPPTVRTDGNKPRVTMAFQFMTRFGAIGMTVMRSLMRRSSAAPWQQW